MLYDPKWEDVYSLEGFLQWLETQPFNQSYDYSSPQNCAIMQYLKARGAKKEGDYMSHDEVVALGWHGFVNVGCSYTFGRVARRIRRHLYGPWFCRLGRFIMEKINAL